MFTPDERLLYAYTYFQFQQKDILLDFWQDRYIKSRSRFIAINKSRRVGWSFMCSMKGLIKSQDPDRVGYTKQFVSYNEEDAIEKINYAKQFYDSIPECDAKKKIKTDNKTMLEFYDNSGKTISRLISIPCRPPRGKGGDICLDEFAIYQPRMSKIVYDAALPVISRGGCIEIGSSPLGKIGTFYDILTDEDNYDFERYSIPWWFCRDLCVDVPMAIKVAPYLSTVERVEKFGTKIIQKIFMNTDIETFQQEYECLFVDDAESYITLDLIYSNTPGKRDDDLDLSLCQNMSDEEYWEYNRDIDFQSYKDVDTAILNYNPEKHGKPLYFGYDVGRFHDATSIYLIGITEEQKKRSFARIEMRGVEYQKQQDAILKLYKELPIFRGFMDKTGMGSPIYEALHKKLGDRIEGIQFTQEMKEVIAIDVKRGLENKEFLLENNKDFHNQIHSIKRTSNGGKHFTYDANRNDKGHADSFWSWGLANYAIGNLQNKISFYEQMKAKKEAEKVQEKIDETKEIQKTYYDEPVKVNKGKSLRQINKMLGLN